METKIKDMSKDEFFGALIEGLDFIPPEKKQDFIGAIILTLITA